MTNTNNATIEVQIAGTDEWVTIPNPDYVAPAADATQEPVTESNTNTEEEKKMENTYTPLEEIVADMLKDKASGAIKDHKTPIATRTVAGIKKVTTATLDGLCKFGKYAWSGIKLWAGYVWDNKLNVGVAMGAVAAAGAVTSSVLAATVVASATTASVLVLIRLIMAKRAKAKMDLRAYLDIAAITIDAAVWTLLSGFCGVPAVEAFFTA